MREKVPPEQGMRRELFHATALEAPFPVLPEFLLAGKTEVDGAAHFPAHRHDNYEVVIVASGRYDCRVNGTRLRLDGGDVLVLKPKDVHEETFTPPLRYGIVHFALPSKGDPGTSVDIFSPDLGAEQRCLRKAAAKLQPAHARLAHEATASDGFAMVMQDALIAAFVVDLLRCFQPALLRKEYRPGERLDGFAQRLTRVFSHNIGRRLSIAQLARQLDISRRTLIHQCRKELATSPAHAFAEFKANRALVLLRETTLPIAEISRMLGFDNQFHFSRVFKRVHGKPPKAMRRQH